MRKRRVSLVLMFNRAEILPLRARARGTAVGISSNWLWVRSTAVRPFVALTPRGTAELRHRHDYARHHQPPAVEGVPHFHVHESPLRPARLLLLPGDGGPNA